MTRRVNGFLLEKMLRNGLANIRAEEETINGLNVFPVADGDTGLNMRLTLENGLRRAKGRTEIGLYLRELSEGMLLGARGNSGVILSQIFKGIYQELARCQAANIADMRNALIRGYRVAYQSVVCPVEGTILTVAREGIELIRTQLDRNTSIESLLGMYIAQMRKTLAATPDMLAVLKEYGVVDSGAVGYITIFEGMYKYLCGETLQDSGSGEIVPRTDISEDIFNENSPFEEGYCMEFILQLMNGDSYNHRFRITTFTEDLKLFGNSIVVTQDGTRVKVHIHTMKPGKVIAMSQEFGEFLTFKLDNMQVQHNEFIRKMPKQERVHLQMAVVAVVNGAGMQKVFTDLGCTVVLDGSSKMNTSTQEFLDAFREANADTIVVLPNNKNIVRAAEQAAAMFGESEIHVLPTTSMVEGYYALSMDIPDEVTDKRIKAMLSGAGNIVTLSQTIASRDYAHNGIGCKVGEEIALVNDRLVFSCRDTIEAVMGGLHKIEGIADKEYCVIFRGEDVDPAQESILEDAIREEYPLLELQFMDGGQRIYRWLLGVI
ncbi:MAG: DAK2 domain-containing protein [Lachnospiraceae bacterium]